MFLSLKILKSILLTIILSTAAKANVESQPQQQCSSYLQAVGSGGLAAEVLDLVGDPAHLRPIHEVVSSSNTLEGSYFNYALQTERWKHPEILPRFVSPTTESELVKKWTGIQGPKTMQAFLPEGTAYIGHQLREPASPYVVKVQETGATVMLRVSKDEWGFDTNIAYSKYAGMAYMSEPPAERYLVRKDARAAIIYLHGGGTPTTGAHIAEGEINHYSMYKVDVVSLDMAAHGEGSRDFFANGQEEIDRIYKFIQRAVPAGVPVFVVGHSMGGVYADLMMRQSDHPDYPMRDVIKGFGILSPAVDPLPGGTPYEKAVEMGRRMDAQKVDPDFDKKAAPSEREIFDQMARDGKLNPIASFHIGMIMSMQEHTPPAHGGEAWTPGIMVVGEGDPLVYIGFEDLFEKAFDLSNVETHSIATAPDRENEVKRVGHLLADYYVNGEVLPLKLVRNFISDRLRAMDPNAKPLETSKKVDAKDSASVFQAYASDLVFRQWVDGARMVLKENAEGFKDLARLVPQIETQIRTMFEGFFETKNIRKAKYEIAKLSESDVLIRLKDVYQVPSEEYKDQPLEALIRLLIFEDIPVERAEEVAKLVLVKRNLESKRDGTWVPEELEADPKTKLLMESIANGHEQLDKLRHRKNELLQELRGFEQRKITVEAQVKQTIKDMDIKLAEVLPERARALASKFVVVKEKFYSATEKIEIEAGQSISIHGELLASEKERLFDKYSAELDHVYEVLADYKKYRQETEALFEEEILKGKLGPEKQQLFEEYFGRTYLATGETTAESLLGRYNRLQYKIAEYEGRIYRRYLSIGMLEQDYWTRINPGLVKIEIASVKDLFDRAIKDDGQVDLALVTKIWKQWTEIKK